MVTKQAEVHEGILTRPRLTVHTVHSHATPQSREQAAKVRASFSIYEEKNGRKQLTAEMSEALSGLVAEGRLDPMKFASIIRGEEEVPKELIEGVFAA